ncbi:hypothetical protein CRUP_016701 [Coryphaenoides rupestris]|nr:hypothetical protein CRUP_016701 [Coryphaenoides rupestris]
MDEVDGVAMAEMVRWRGEGEVRAVAPERCLDEGGAGEEKEETAERFSGTSDAMKKSRSAQGVTPGGDADRDKERGEWGRPHTPEELPREEEEEEERGSRGRGVGRPTSLPIPPPLPRIDITVADPDR